MILLFKLFFKGPKETFHKIRLTGKMFVCVCVCVCVCARARARVASQAALVEKNLPTNEGDVKRCRFNPWVGKIPWRKAWQPTSVFLPGESHGQRSFGGLQSMGLKRARHN